jgi:hypothetical protein
MVVGQDEDVGHQKADHNQGLQGDQASQVVNPGESVPAVFVTVTEIMENHHNYHEDSIANREDVERSSTDVLGPDIELKNSLRQETNSICNLL